MTPTKRPPAPLRPLPPHRIWRDRRGASAIEYGLLVALLASVLFGAWLAVGTQLTNIFTQLAEIYRAAAERAGSN